MVEQGSEGVAARSGPASLTERSLAKINLDLKVVGRFEDGRHDLDSLVVFAPPFDELAVATLDELGQLDLALDGPFAAAAPPGEDNIVLRAARAMRDALGREDGLAFRLVKNVPVGAGLGGGSGDAAAALRAINRLWGRPLNDLALRDLGAELGADVPVCVFGRPARMRGVGERLDPVRCLPQLWLLLVRPPIEVSTAAVFERFREQCASGDATMGKRANAFHMVPSTVRFATWLTGSANDLESAAIALHPEIGEVLEALRADEDVLVARMSGSGAACYAMYRNEATAEQAAARLMEERPDWWVFRTLAYDEGG